MRDRERKRDDYLELWGGEKREISNEINIEIEL